ncbi:MAG TPA: ankyrin repeat domain-containing protein [Bryobacteraceae bacterium]|nr:ankyrin repeat domain-containing protein [Bryobacteraceae bacterium]
MSLRKFLISWLAVVLPLAAWGAELDNRVARAAMSGDRSAVRALAAGKADVNAPLADGTTALDWAVRSGDQDTADVLIRAGANVQAADRYGLTPLAIACSNADAPMVKRLLDAGADANAADPNGQTALMVAARTDGGADVVRLLLERGAAVNARDKVVDQTALMLAVRADQAESVRLLLAGGAEVNARTRTGKTPPRRPPNAGGGSHGKGIVRGGWPDRGAQDPTPGAMTALLYAARDGRLEMARMLVMAGADVNQPEANKVTPLLIAIANDHLALANFLLTRGADVNAADYWGRTPLWTALDIRDLDYDRSGEQHSDRAAALEMMQTLLNRGAHVNARIAEVPPIRRWILPISDISWVDFTGQTPFLRAALAGDITVMRLLLEHGADPNIPTFSNTTALMAAAGVNWSVGQTYTESKEGWMEAVKLCLEKGADVNTVNTMGFTALTGAVNRGSDEIVQFLVDHGAKMDVTDNEGRTLRDWAEGVFLATVPPQRKPTTIALLEKLAAEHAGSGKAQ